MLCRCCCSELRTQIETWLRDYDRIQSSAVVLIYIQVRYLFFLLLLPKIDTLVLLLRNFSVIIFCDDDYTVISLH